MKGFNIGINQKHDSSKINNINGIVKGFSLSWLRTTFLQAKLQLGLRFLEICSGSA